jgi:hypothetical protein
LHLDVTPVPSASHTVCPVGQDAAHVPPAVHTAPPVAQRGTHEPEHVCPCVHAVPHAPQLLKSVERSMHAPLQRLNGLGQKVPPSGPVSGGPPPPLSVLLQSATQLPATQLLPASHLVPHTPQLFESLCRLVQKPVPPLATVPQTVWPVGHAARQAPFAQTSPLAQYDVHAPALQ